MEKAMVILSGGQDSVTCLLMAIEKYKRENVEAISYIYNGKYRKDVECAKIICKKLKIKHNIFDAGIIQSMGKSNNVEGRNLILITLASIYAQTKNIHNIIIGLAGNSIHPDCTKDFVEELQKTIMKATSYEINIIAPLINLKKSEIWEIADKLGYLEFVENETYSCWNSQKEHCKECLSCQMRFKGLEEYKEKRDGREYKYN